MPSIEVGTTANPLPSAELNLAGTSTAEKQFLMASASGSLAAGQPLTCFAPGSNTLLRRPFRVRVGGRLVGGSAATNFTAILYQGTSSTIASNRAIATTGAIAVAANTTAWDLIVDLVWSGTQLVGILRGFVHVTAVAQAVLTNTAAITTLNTENTTNNGFTITGTFSAGQAANVAYVDWFEILTQ